MTPSKELITLPTNIFTGISMKFDFYVYSSILGDHLEALLVSEVKSRKT